MKYFNGFCLLGEERLLGRCATGGAYALVGFSYGAINALRYALKCPTRIDTLILLSPAFFQTYPDRFKVMQLKTFKKHPQDYIMHFLQNIQQPHDPQDLSDCLCVAPNAYEQLSDLLHYTWQSTDLQSLKDKGVLIEVHLGAKDAIIDPVAARDFFAPFADVYWNNHTGHLLQRHL